MKCGIAFQDREYSNIDVGKKGRFLYNVIQGMGIISEIDFFISKKSFIKRIINKICMEVERFSYTKRMSIAGKYNPAIAAIESSKYMEV